MPKPIEKNEQDLRESEIADIARAEVNVEVNSFRRRVLNASVTRLVEEFREDVTITGTLPTVDANYIRDRVHTIVNEITSREVLTLDPTAQAIDA